MVEEWNVPVWAVLAASAGAAALLVALLVLAVLGSRTRIELRALRSRVAGLEERAAAPEPASQPAPEVAAAPVEQYVITTVAEPGGPGEPVVPAGASSVPAPLFADLVLRESVVQAASLVAGLRRALSPEVRNRVRFEVRQEVRRSRRQRRADDRAARRAWEAAQRAEAAGAARGSAA